FFPPTVLADVTPEMRIAQEETFGPVLVVMPVRDDAHAIEVANGTAFALSATIMTTSPERARRLAAGIRSGSVAWNDFGLTYMAMDLPFGGVDGSGFGRLNGAEGIRGMTNRRAVLEDRLPLRVPAKVFPVDEGTYTRTKETLRAIYGRGLRTRLAGLSGLIGGAAGRRQPAASVPGDPEGDRG
ncbi:MAG TPA: aldehyde dehydrogenase family protein, partial [Polyangiaceae bacterium LLY-WYZ-14_1]|nr:aldehyde dehydrogenase family protein [Polyangiaceae bacterium LLY-WYZ-14_1]